MRSVSAKSSHFLEISGRRVHRFTGGSRLQEARAYASGEARAQLHDGHTINEKGKAVVHARDVPL